MSIPRMASAWARRLVRVGRQLDAAGLAPAAHLHLGLDHHRVADAVGDLHRLGHRGDRCAVGHRDAVAREQLLALIFEEIHAVRHGGRSQHDAPQTGGFAGIRVVHRLPWPCIASDAKLLLVATGAVVARRCARRRGAAPRHRPGVEPDEVPAVRRRRRVVDQAAAEGRWALLRARPVRREPQHPARAGDGKVVALSDIMPGHEGLPGAVAGLDQLLRRLPRRQAQEHRPRPVPAPRSASAAPTRASCSSTCGTAKPAPPAA